MSTDTLSITGFCSVLGSEFYINTSHNTTNHEEFHGLQLHGLDKSFGGNSSPLLEPRVSH